MEVFIFVLIGIVIGFIGARLYFKPKSVGILWCCTSDPDGPYLFLESSKSIDDLMKRKYATFDVKFK